MTAVVVTGLGPDGQPVQISREVDDAVIAARQARAQTRRQDRQSEISRLDFFYRFTDEEKMAVIQACAASPALNVGLINGLAAVSVTLTSEKMSAWMDGLVAAGAITAVRKAEILAAPGAS